MPLSQTLSSLRRAHSLAKLGWKIASLRPFPSSLPHLFSSPAKPGQKLSFAQIFPSQYSKYLAVKKSLSPFLAAKPRRSCYSNSHRTLRLAVQLDYPQRPFHSRAFQKRGIWNPTSGRVGSGIQLPTEPRLQGIIRRYWTGPEHESTNSGNRFFTKKRILYIAMPIYAYIYSAPLWASVLRSREAVTQRRYLELVKSERDVWSRKREMIELMTARKLFVIRRDKAMYWLAFRTWWSILGTSVGGVSIDVLLPRLLVESARMDVFRRKQDEAKMARKTWLSRGPATSNGSDEMDEQMQDTENNEDQAGTEEPKGDCLSKSQGTRNGSSERS